MGQRRAGVTALCCCIVMVALVQAVFITPASSVRFLEMIVRTGDAIQSEADIDYMISQALRTHIEGAYSFGLHSFQFQEIVELIDFVR